MAFVIHYQILALTFCILLFIAFAIPRSARSKASPSQSKQWPSPPSLPILGSAHLVPIQYMWKMFEQWSKEYGPVYKLNLLGTNFLIVSDEKIAEELLVKRAKTYSDRPEMKSLFDSKSSSGTMEYLPLMGRNVFWSRQRKFAHSYMTDASNNRYGGIMEFEVKRWLYRLVETPSQFSSSLEDMASKIMCQLAWDDPEHSEYLSRSAWGLLTQMSPGGPITNVLTPLWDYLPEPINPWKIIERKRHDEQNAWWMKRHLIAQEQNEKGQLRDSWVKKYFDSGDHAPFSTDHEASCAIGMMALVGVFTVAGPLSYFIMAMVEHPIWASRCQKELDEVCSNRLPMIADSKNLPILRACIKETMRWRPNVPTGVAHEVEQDDHWNGYFIPKGTRILPLDCAMLKNPNKYPKGEEFRPERWLEAGWPTYQEPLSKYPTVVGMTSFGWGRRTCLGQRLTQDELLVACGGILWGFDLKKKIDPVTGLEKKIDTAKSNSILIIRPDPYDLEILPRFPERRALILKQWNLADAADQSQRGSYRSLTPQEKFPRHKLSVGDVYHVWKLLF